VEPGTNNKEIEMIMKVHDRREVEGNGIALEEPYVMISISCVNDAATIPHREHCKDILRLEFDDVDRPIEGMNVSLFNKEHANKILDFFEKWENKVAWMIVHCDAGLSRSPAVAAALTRVQHRFDYDFWKRYLPNSRVYSILLNTHFERSEEAHAKD
jgi:predicted protein tyrosine phosphatase